MLEWVNRVQAGGPTVPAQAPNHIATVRHAQVNDAIGRQTSTQFLQRLPWIGQVLEYLVGIDKIEFAVSLLQLVHNRHPKSLCMIAA
jgi:hypothetical protein